MAIDLTRYVDITSGVGAGQSVAIRSFTARLFSENPLIPTNAFVTFTNADDVESYFGSNSEEYARALPYFGFISKNITSPQSIDYARWANVATAPQIFGAPGAQSLTTWNAITTGAFTLTMGSFTHSFTALDFSAAGSLAAVAADIQAAIRTYSAGGSLFTAATVIYDAVRQCFDLTGGATGNEIISVAAGGSGNDIAGQLGWLSPSAIFSDGVTAQSITDILSASANASDNFGSFTFMPVFNLAQVQEAAAWNKTQNNKFMYSVNVAIADSSAWSAALLTTGGVTLTLASPVTADYPEQDPMTIQAATNYQARNSVQNYMFQQFDGQSASVTTDADANTYDGLRINYYGQTQTAGRLIEFYQRGLMMGEATDPTDQNTYANEIWLKDASAAAIMTVLLSLPELPANAAGRAQLLAILQGVIDQALTNGTIEAGKSLTSAQQLFISNITGDAQAWKQVQNIGYWVDAQIVPVVDTSDATEYKAVYTLIYSKNDVIRKVEGKDVLI